MSGPWIVGLAAAIALTIVLIAAKFPNLFDKVWTLTASIGMKVLLIVWGLGVLYYAIQFAWCTVMA
jgi:hypothetical protein